MDAPRFVADAMLGRLARWLRILGLDTVYDPSLDDPALVALADAEGRALLTRDRHLVEHLRPPRALLVRSDAALDQLREVVQEFGIGPPFGLFTRCPVCNGALRPATDEEAATLVPEQSRDVPGPVRRCPDCGRVYWQGSHTERMRRALVDAFPDWPL